LGIFDVVAAMHHSYALLYLVFTCYALLFLVWSVLNDY